MSKVYCQEIKEDLLKDFDKFLNKINFKKYIKNGDIILIKPNICAPCMPSSGAITKPLLIVHLAEKIKKYGGEPIIAESSIGNGITHKSFSASGLKALCSYKKIKLINLEKDKPIQKDKFKYCSIIDKVDKIINFPVLKTHHNKDLMVSLSLKNLMGLLWKNQKSLMHVKGIEDSIINLNQTIKPVLNILDATICMEGNGPVAGSPIKIGLLLASEDRVALDSIGCLLMGFETFPNYLIKAEKVGLGTTKPKVEGVQISKFKKNFKKAPPFKENLISKVKDYLLSIRIFHKFLYNFSSIHRLPKPKIPIVDKNICIHCKHCLEICPFYAIKFENNFPVFDKDKCVKCYACVEICPQGALKH